MLHRISLIFLVSFSLAAGTSKLYWNYFFIRPSSEYAVPAGVRARAISLIALENLNRPTDLTTIVGKVPAECSRELCSYSRSFHALMSMNESGYYCFNECLLANLDDISSLSNLPTVDKKWTTQAMETLNLSLKQGASGEHISGDACWLQLIAIEFELNDSKQLGIGAVGCPDAQDDDRRWYEQARFRFTEDGLALVSRERFFYEIAGLEGFQFPLLAMVYGFIGLVALVTFEVVRMMKG